MPRVFGLSLRVFSVWVILQLFLPCEGYGADNLYFTGLTLENRATSQRMVFLQWDALEGTVPADIAAFRLYRKESGQDYAQLAEISNALVPASTLRGYFMESGETERLAEILDWLYGVYPETEPTTANFHTLLHDVLNPQAPGCTSTPPAETCKYRPLRVSFLTRYSRDVARALGRAYMDRAVSPNTTYTYMLTGIRTDDSETSPLGKVTLDTASETVLPAPAGFEQVRVSKCSAMLRSIDHARVHFTWALPSGAQQLGSRILIQGYDLYRTERDDLGTVDLRNGVPTDVIRINDMPITPSGPPPEAPPHNYLAIDEGDFLDTGKALEPGTTYYYYLVARDLSGRYSNTTGPLEVVVPDLEVPVSPWNVSSQREMTDVGGGVVEPRLTLIWDQVNNVNYLKAYGFERQICGASPDRVCYVENDSACEEESPFCVDLAVVDYLVYRFETFEDAVLWGGTDSDNDLWPDQVEDLDEDGELEPGDGETDWCDPLAPGGLPTTVVQVISQDDPDFMRIVDSGKTYMAFRDPVPQPDNRVYWYRVAARDAGGNRSELSPPLRAVLWDRSQPDVVNATLEVNQCPLQASFFSDGEAQCDRNGPDLNANLSVFDETGLAAGFGLYEVCTDHLRLVTSGELFDGKRELYYDPADAGSELYEHCNNHQDPCGPYMVRFFASDGSELADSAPFTNPLCNLRAGCVVLYRRCEYVGVGTGGTGFGVVHDPIAPFRICVDLAEDQCGRVYQEIGGDMTPVASFCYPEGQTGMQRQCEQIPVRSIVSTNVCLGVQVFSANHVGSGMHYLPCATVATASPYSKPATPEIEKVIKQGSSSSPAFEVTWGCQSEGIAAFILSARDPDGMISYESIWDPEANDITLMYEETVNLAAADINKKWCFRVRAVNRALRMSDWSQTACRVWDQQSSDTYLKWPAMSDLSRGKRISEMDHADITAFVIKGEKLPALVLSSDLRGGLETLVNRDLITGYLVGDRACEYEVGRCQAAACTSPPDPGGWWPGDTPLPWTTSYFQCPMCPRLWRQNKIGDFIVYRQRENEDFVQVSPLVDQGHCSSGWAEASGFFWSALEDPLITLAELETGSVAGGEGLTQTALETVLEGTTRLLFLDYYPVRQGVRVRYQVVGVDPATREPRETFMSNWVEIPLAE